MTASLRFVLDPQTKTELPDFADQPLEFADGQSAPATGDTVTLAAIAGHSFVVKDRLFAYDASGSVTVTVHLTLASERSI